MTRVDVGIVVPLELSRELLTCLVSEKNRFQCVCVQFCVCMPIASVYECTVECVWVCGCGCGCGCVGVGVCVCVCVGVGVGVGVWG